MATFNPVFGDLLTAKEVVELTGFTMNQLRNWRIPARQSLAPFGFVSIGVSPHYRKVVVEAWVERNGGSNISYTPSGLDAEFPIGEVAQMSVDQRLAFNTLSKMTTDNVYHWMLGRLDEGKSFREAWQNAWAKFSDTYLTYHQRMENPEWYRLAVQTQRLLVSEQQGFGLSVDEIKAMPVGAVPPLKDKK